MEETFKRWRAEDRSFYVETTLPFAANDRNGHLKPAEVFRLFMEIAGDDFGERGLSHKYMMDRGYYFILTRAQVHFASDIPDTAHVTLRTWPYKTRSLQVYRGYEMRDADGALVACGTGVFMIIGPEGKPIRMSDFPFLSWDDVFCDAPVEYESKGRIRAKGDLAELGTVRASFNDLDRNGHVNNARYLAYAQDCLPVELQNRHITDVAIVYDAETREGADLHVRCDASACANGRLQPGEDGWVSVYGQGENGEPSFGCRFRFADAEASQGSEGGE